MNYSKIDTESAKKALLKSGYILESRLESALRQYGYFAEPNCLFTDPLTNKKREIDLIGYGYPKVIRSESEPYHDIEACLIVECKNYSQPLTFIENTARKNCEFFNEAIYRSLAEVSGRPQQIICDNYPENLQNFISRIKSKFYDGKIIYSSQYCTFFQNKQKEWIACHSPQEVNGNGENEHSLFEKLFTYVDIGKREFWDKYACHPGNVYFMVFYPILVVQNELWIIKQEENNDLVIQETSHIHYIRSHTTGSEEQRFHVDVITEAYFPQYLALINEQLTLFLHEINANFEDFEKGLELHIKQASTRGRDFERHSLATTL